MLGTGFNPLKVVSGKGEGGAGTEVPGGAQVKEGLD